MQKQTRYAISNSTVQACRILGVDPGRVLRRAGVPQAVLQDTGLGVTAAQFFAIWGALMEESDRPGLPMELARMLARGPFEPALFAFSCSPDVLTGLERLAIFKPLVAPVRLLVKPSPETVTLEVSTGEAAIGKPMAMAAFELVYFIEICRNFTGADIVPLKLEMPKLMPNQAEYDRYFGRRVVLGSEVRLTLSRADAQRPLISENPELWAGFERDLTRQLAQRQRNMAMSERVRDALLELLPAGQATVDAVCARLLTSRRSLQRHLKEEGKTFQRVLDATREDLSMHYLKSGDLSVEEISFLLAYRDPNSFYRAFQSWTGLTPKQVRDAGQKVDQNLH
ncbi:AraC family transcriptional regulator ligand-binding domain-containing protein [Shimia sp. W99]